MDDTRRVLLVDDDAGFANLAAEFLEREDDHLVAVTETSAEAALDRLAALGVDCVVSDYEMPGVDGLSFLERVRQRGTDVPFILFTGKSREEIAIRALNLGADRYIQKGGDPEAQFGVLADAITQETGTYRTERQLAEQERYLSEVVAQSPTATFVIDRDHVVTFWNAACEELMGIDAGDVVGTTEPYRAFYDEPRPVLADLVVDGGDPERLTEWYGDAWWESDFVEGAYGAEDFFPNENVWVRFAAAPLRDDDGEVIGAIETLENVTLRQGRERDLEVYGAVVENVDDAVFVLDSELRVQFMNDWLVELLDLGGFEWRGRELSALVDERDVLDAAAGSQILDAARAVLDAPQTTAQREVTFHGESRPRTVDLQVSALDGAETLDGVVGVGRDITDRYEREAQIEALHDAAIEIEACESADAVYQHVVDVAETILEYDIALADAVEGDELVPRATSAGVSSAAYYESTPVDAEDNLGARAFRAGESILVDDLRETDVAPADSTYRSALTVPIGSFGLFHVVSKEVGAFDENDRELVELLVAHARETLARLRQEQALRERTRELERQNERLEEFASLVSHDLRSPLTVAQGRLDLARQESDSEHLAAVARAHDRMDELIDELLTLTRLGRAIEETESVDVAELLTECWETVPTADATLDIEADVVIDADPMRLRTLFENLFRDAIEHAGETVAVRVGVLPTGDGIFVEDDGPGVPESERERVFEPGYSTGAEGTGLGLAIVREIADAHGWDVRLTEGDAGGARFEFSDVKLG